MSRDLNAVRRNGIVDELHTRRVVSTCESWVLAGKLTWLSSGASLLRHFWITWLPLRSLMSTTTCKLSARMMEWICRLQLRSVYTAP